MQPKCKFCGKEIHDDHYFITKNGTICLNCKEKIHDEMGSFCSIRNNLHFNFNRSKREVKK